MATRPPGPTVPGAESYHDWRSRRNPAITSSYTDSYEHRDSFTLPGEVEIEEWSPFTSRPTEAQSIQRDEASVAPVVLGHRRGVFVVSYPPTGSEHP